MTGWWHSPSGTDGVPLFEVKISRYGDSGTTKVESVVRCNGRIHAEQVSSIFAAVSRPSTWSWRHLSCMVSNRLSIISCPFREYPVSISKLQYPVLATFEVVACLRHPLPRFLLLNRSFYKITDVWKYRQNGSYFLNSSIILAILAMFVYPSAKMSTFPVHTNVQCLNGHNKYLFFHSSFGENIFHFTLWFGEYQ